MSFRTCLRWTRRGASASSELRACGGHVLSRTAVRDPVEAGELRRRDTRRVRIADRARCARPRVGALALPLPAFMWRESKGRDVVWQVDALAVELTRNHGPPLVILAAGVRGCTIGAEGSWHTVVPVSACDASRWHPSRRSAFAMLWKTSWRVCCQSSALASRRSLSSGAWRAGKLAPRATWTSSLFGEGRSKTLSGPYPDRHRHLDRTPRRYLHPPHRDGGVRTDRAHPHGIL